MRSANPWVTHAHLHALFPLAASTQVRTSVPGLRGCLWGSCGVGGIGILGQGAGLWGAWVGPSGKGQWTRAVPDFWGLS